MPRYDFRCHDCTTIFEEQRSFTRASAPATCPQCGSGATYKLLSQVNVLGGSSQSEPALAPKASGCGCTACSCGH